MVTQKFSMNSALKFGWRTMKYQFWFFMAMFIITILLAMIPNALAGKADSKWVDSVTGMEFVWVEGGCFQMGQTEAEKETLIKEVGEENYKEIYAPELPRHEVCLEGFWMGKYEVTNKQYRTWKAKHNSGKYGEESDEGRSLNDDSQPVVWITWGETQEFTEWLTKQHQGKYTFRLPTEAEWEYAARAGTTTSRFWGDDPADACQYANVHDQASEQAFRWGVFLLGWTPHKCNDGYAVAAPVGSFRPNEFGLYDMLGNVWEWCLDTYHESYDGAPFDGSVWGNLGDKKKKVVRGGSWYNTPPDCRSAVRYRSFPIFGYDSTGFRLVVGSSSKTLP